MRLPADTGMTGDGANPQRAGDLNIPMDSQTDTAPGL
jgi:hypothetical protein